MILDYLIFHITDAFVRNFPQKRTEHIYFKDIKIALNEADISYSDTSCSNFPSFLNLQLGLIGVGNGHGIRIAEFTLSLWVNC